MCDSPSYSEVDSASLQLPNVLVVQANDPDEPIQDFNLDMRLNASNHSTPSTLRCQSTFVLNQQQQQHLEEVTSGTNYLKSILNQLGELRTKTQIQLEGMRNQLDLLSNQVNSAEVDLNSRIDSIVELVSKLLVENLREQQLPPAFDVPSGVTSNPTVSSPCDVKMSSGTGDVTSNLLVHPVPAVRSSKVLSCPTNGTNDVKLNQPTAATNATFNIEPTTIVPMDTLENGTNSNSILNPIITRKFYRLPAMVKGYLTRRLYNCHEVLELKKTIADTVIELLDFENISEDSITPEDLILHQQIVVQLDRCLEKFHHLFFTLPIKQRMLIITRQREREFHARRSLSVASSRHTSSRLSSRSSTRKTTRSNESHLKSQGKKAQPTDSSSKKTRSRTFIVRNEPSIETKIISQRDR